MVLQWPSGKCNRQMSLFEFLDRAALIERGKHGALKLFLKSVSVRIISRGNPSFKASSCPGQGSKSPALHHHRGGLWGFILLSPLPAVSSHFWEISKCAQRRAWTLAKQGMLLFTNTLFKECIYLLLHFGNITQLQGWS